MSATVHHTAVRHTPALLVGVDRSSVRPIARPVVRRHHPPRPNYALRRLGALVCVVVAGALAAQVAVGAAGALAGLDSRPAAASEAVPAAGDTAVPGVHVAEPGDTLWSIADRHRGDVDRSRYVDRLIALNGGTTIEIGQAVRLP